MAEDLNALRAVVPPVVVHPPTYRWVHEPRELLQALFRLAASFAGQGLNLQGSFVRFLRASISSSPPHPGFAWRTRSSANHFFRNSSTVAGVK